MALTGSDLVGLAETGSGKTAAFTIPIAERLASSPTKSLKTRGLILSPTREIALQTQTFLDLFGGDYGLRTACLIGGVKMGPQHTALRHKPHIIVATPGRLLDHMEHKPHIIVATPGRLLDHMEQGTARLGDVDVLVLDEADHMLDMGFLPQVLRILQQVPTKRQTLMFSATMPPPIERLAQQFMSEPVRVDITPKGAAAGISHRLYLVEPENKKACLLALLNQELGSTLVFIRRKTDAEWLSHVLEREGSSGRAHPLGPVAGTARAGPPGLPRR